MGENFYRRKTLVSQALAITAEEVFIMEASSSMALLALRYFGTTSGVKQSAHPVGLRRGPFRGAYSTKIGFIRLTFADIVIVSARKSELCPAKLIVVADTLAKIVSSKFPAGWPGSGEAITGLTSRQKIAQISAAIEVTKGRPRGRPRNFIVFPPFFVRSCSKTSGQGTVPTSCRRLSF